MTLTGILLKRLASLNLTTEAFQEVLAIIAEMQAADEAKRERWRVRKQNARDKGGGENVSETSARQSQGKPGDKVPPDPLKEVTCSEPNGSSQGAVAPVAYIDDKAKLFGIGRPILLTLGVERRDVGTMIGRWLKQAANNYARVLWAIEEAGRTCPADPVPYITALLRSDNGQRTASPINAAYDELMADMRRGGGS